MVLGQLPVLILSNLLLGELTDLVSFRSRGQGDRNTGTTHTPTASVENWKLARLKLKIFCVHLSPSLDPRDFVFVYPPFRSKVFCVRLSHPLNPTWEYQHCLKSWTTKWYYNHWVTQPSSHTSTEIENSNLRSWQPLDNLGGV